METLTIIIIVLALAGFYLIRFAPFRIPFDLSFLMQTAQRKEPSGIVITKLVMRCLVTLVLLALSIYVILYFPESDKKWAFASLGTIAGYWLSKSEK